MELLNSKSGHDSHHNWIKCNTDGASRGNIGISTCGGIFKDNLLTFFGAFIANIGASTSFQVELHGIMLSTKFANRKNWRNLWMDNDSMLTYGKYMINLHVIITILLSYYQRRQSLKEGS